MRSFLLSLSVFLIVLAGALTGAWFIQANEIKKGIERAIAQINAVQPVITYASITTSGFPSDVMVSINQPRFKGRVDLLLKALAESAPQPTQPMLARQKTLMENMKPWQEDAALDGAIVFTINALSDHYSMSINGNWSSTGLVDGQTVSTAGSMGGSYVCTLQLARADGLFIHLWNARSLARDGADYLRDFRLLDCVHPAYAITDQATKRLLFSSGGSRVYMSSTPQNERRQIRLYLKTADAEASAEGDKIAGIYLSALFPDTASAAHASLYGKQNIEIDLSYDGPAYWQNGADNNVSLSMSKFTVENQLYHINAAFAASNQVNGDSRSDKLVINAKANFSAPFDALLQDAVHGAVNGFYAAKDQPPQLQAYLRNHTPAQLEAALLPVLPQLHTLGDLTQRLDIAFDGGRNFKTGDIRLAALELSAKPYGITGSGSAHIGPLQLLPSANITLACANCLSLVDDAGAYAMRTQSALAALGIGRETLNTALIGGIKHFLSALAQPAGTNAFAYTIISNGMGSLTINGKPIDQILLLYNQNIAPYLPPTPPVAIY